MVSFPIPALDSVRDEFGNFADAEIEDVPHRQARLLSTDDDHLNDTFHETSLPAGYTRQCWFSCDIVVV